MDVALLGPERHGLADGVRAGRLDGADESQEGGLVLGGVDGGQRHGSSGERAGLVEHDGVELRSSLEHRSGLEEHAELCTPARPHHDGGGGGESQGTRAGDDENRDRVAKGRGDLARAHEPSDEHDGGDGDDDRDEDARDTVGEPLDGGLRGLGLLDEADDLGECRVGSDVGDFDHEPALLVDGGAEDTVAGDAFDRHRLAGQHALVDRRAALEDGAVHGHLLAGEHHDPIAGGERQRVDDFDLPIRPHHPSLGRGELEEARHRLRGAAFGAGFEEPPEEDERDDHPGGLEEERLVGEERPDRIAVGGEGTHRDEGVHARLEGTKPFGGGDVELATEPEHDGCGQEQLEESPPGTFGTEHREHHERHREQPGADRVGALLASLLCVTLHDRYPFALFERPDVVADPGDGLLQTDDVGPRSEICARLLAGEVDDCAFDALLFAQDALDTQRTGGARHALDVEDDGLTHGRRSLRNQPAATS